MDDVRFGPNAADTRVDSLDESACPVCLREACEDHLSAPSDNAPALTFLSARDVIAEPAPVEIIEGVASAGRVSVFVSEPGSGKTFITLDMAAHVSAGLSWHRRAVHAGSVAFVSYEGDALGLRLRALREVAGQKLEHVHILRASDPLSPLIDRDRIERPSRGELDLLAALLNLRDDLAKAGSPPIVLLVIDTVRASLSGSEDSSESVSAYLRAVRRLVSHLPGAAAILTHHAGWQDGEAKRKRERGSSAFRGNVDATLYLETEEYDADKGEARLLLRTLKVRDGERPPPVPLIRRRAYLNGDDGHGQPLSSCVIERDRRTPEDREAEAADRRAAADRKLDLAVLRVMRDTKATSQTAVREHVGGRQNDVVASISRLLQAGWATRPAQRQPFVLTETGHAALSEAG